MPHTIQLDRYLERIGFTGTARADLATLRTIQQLHPTAIPFENLNPFTGAPVKLDLGSVEQKLVQQGRGGYCFEQNKLLKAALEQIGFRVTGLAARVIFNLAVDAVSPYSHMLLLIDLDGQQYLADSGFGGMSPTGPLLLQPDLEQSTPHESYRLLRQDHYYRLESKVKEEWKHLYKFPVEAHFEQDYEVMNWYTSCHPASHFTNTLIAARAFPGGRYALRNTALSTHRLGHASEQQELSDTKEVMDTLREVFKLNISGIAGLEKQIEQLFQK
ncbi:arylamine N-acetyltransferase family protein [Flavilitoribacter nigricans]|uniref:Arylamine N-acetyltransferase n=1 Tax=Flavilitoribacter nigricans (strain ATCC 23147 / DSM 23189 / NBRC 102662 / NCIMB 1420 / SS-2) TaxID=1122177 RepID=A0A2D0N8Z4_FLAN2|nr:arylamine N-acetyltransferase [Flavilitoribacter nigricans]PHN04984.1 arylamine N-acetyltransferase [Flavilitoribacter nigricans DSM 23189 = NBRC 102662]